MSNDKNIPGIGFISFKSTQQIQSDLSNYKPEKITIDFNKINKQQQTTKKTTSQQLHEDWSKVIPNLSKEFFHELVEISKRIKCSAEDFAAILFLESRFDPKATGNGVHGLIQMDQTALNNACEFANLPKISIKNYKKLPREKQLKYAEAYIKFRIDEKNLTGKKLSGGKLWALIKSPKRFNNNSFVKNLQKKIDQAKKIPLKYDTPYSIKHKK